MAPASSNFGGSAADDDESQELLTLGGIGAGLRLLEGAQEPPANGDRVFDRLQSGRVFRPLVVTEIGMRRPCRDDQKVIGNFAAFCSHDLSGRVDSSAFSMSTVTSSRLRIT